MQMFDQLEVVGRGSKTQVGENLDYLIRRCINDINLTENFTKN